MGCQYGEERDNVTENEGERDGWEVVWQRAHLIYTHTLRYCCIVYSLLLHFYPKTVQMTHSDYRLIMLSFNKSDERSGDQVYSKVSQAAEQHHANFITDQL